MAESSAAKHPGDRLASYFENFFRGVIGVATLGASLTFSKIVQSPVDPFHDYGFSSRSIQYLLATSWLLFVLALAFTSFFASALSLWRPQAVAAFGTTTGKDRKKVLWFACAVSAFLFGLAIVAFLTLALVVVAYVGPVGWVAVGFTIFFAVLGYAAILWQSPVQWPTWLVNSEREEPDALESRLESNDGRPRTGYADKVMEAPDRQSTRQHRPAGTEERREKGRSTSAEFGGGRRRSSRREDGYDVNRYSKASTVVTDAYEPGLYGQRGLMMYDDGVREGMVTSRYAN